MKKGKDYLILASGLLLIGACIALLRQYSELKELRAKVSAVAHGQSVRSDEKAGLEKRLRAAEEQTKAVQAELDRARAPISLKTASAGEPAGSAGERKEASIEQTKQWLDSANKADLMRRLNTQAQNLTLRRFGNFFKQLNLPAEQNAQLVRLLTDKRLASVDLAAASLQNGEDPRDASASYQDAMGEFRRELEEQIHALLGDANYTRYLDFLRASQQSNFQKRNQPTPVPPPPGASTAK